MHTSYPENKAGHGALSVERNPADCADHVVEISGDIARLANPFVGDAGVFIGCTSAPQMIEEGGALRAGVTTSPNASYIVVTTQAGTVRAGQAAPEEAWDKALRHYQALASRLTTKTPSPILDASMRGNNMAMDGQWRSPSYLHGALRWGTECGGWYLGWRRWYGPIVAGDLERVATAIRMHFEHQFADPPEGLHSAGKVAPFVSFDGKEKRAQYNMHEVLLDHIRS